MVGGGGLVDVGGGRSEWEEEEVLDADMKLDV